MMLCRGEARVRLWQHSDPRTDLRQPVPEGARDAPADANDMRGGCFLNLRTNMAVPSNLYAGIQRGPRNLRTSEEIEGGRAGIK